MRGFFVAMLAGAEGLSGLKEWKEFLLKDLTRMGICAIMVAWEMSSI